MKKIYLPLIAMLLAFSTLVTVSTSCNTKHETEIGEDDENDEYDGPSKAAEFEYKRNLDPATGTVPSYRMWAAVLETENRKNIVANGTSSTNSLAPLVWIERGSNSDAVGPSNGNTRPGNGVTSGRMRAEWVDLADPTGKKVWVGGISGGLWTTNDITATTPTWTLVNDYLSNLAISGICQDPTNTNTMYFCTGEAYFTGGGVGGVGVFKSTDHGVTWTLLANTSTLVRCTKILCDATGNVYVSTMGISVVVGLQRSTDGGANWVSINPFATAATPTSRIVDFEISSTGAMHVVGGLSSAAGIGGYRYTANPAAATPVWQSATSLYTIPLNAGARVEMTCNGNTVYAAISNAEKINAIAKSVDGGDNWTTTSLTASNITDLNGANGQGTYSNGIIVDPSDPNTVIVGSLRLLKSTDGGLTFSKISEWVGNTGQYVHADIHNMAWVNNGNKLFVGCDGGLFYSTDKGTTFTDKNTGLRLKQFYGVSIHPSSTNYYLAGAQDNGTHQFNGPGLTSSVEVQGGDGGITSIDQDEPQYQTATYVYANFRRSSNGGSSWSSSGSSSTSGQFINPYDLDNTTNKIYAGFAAGQFLRWEDPHTGFTFTPVSLTEFGTASVSCVTVSPFMSNRVYFGLTNGKIIRVDNADISGSIVADITPVGMPITGYVNSISIGTSDQNITATLTNFGVNNIWSSTDEGSTWLSSDGNLPDVPVYWSLYHPDADTKMYIATETGVWSTDSLNGTSTVWTPESSFPTVKTSMLKYRASDRTIAAATYGRGLWTSTIPSGCAAPAITTQPVNTSICAGANTSFSIVAKGTAPLTYKWQVSTAGAGGPWTDLTNTAPYSTVTTTTLNITAATAVLNTYQYRCVVSNCSATSVTSNAGILTVNAVLAAPITSPISYCQNATAVALTAAGTNLLWYTASSGGAGTASIIPSTTTVGTVTYYVSQSATVGGCESPRASLDVAINSTPLAPVVNTPVNYCQNATATVLTATGTNLKWYATASSTSTIPTPTPNTSVLGSITYYVSSTIGTCEGPRAAIVVNVTSVPVAPTVTAMYTYCQGSIAPMLMATGSNLLWYTSTTGGTGSGTAPTPSTFTLGTTSYFVSQTIGCESPRAEIMVTIIAGTPAPIVTTPVVYCQGATANSLSLSATGTALLWYTTASGGPAGTTTPPTVSTTTVGSTTYYVTQTLGICESPRTPITVTINTTPAAPIVTTPINYCQNVTAAQLTATGTNLKWYANAIGGPALPSAPTPVTTSLGTTVYYVSQTTGTCEGPRAAISVIVAAVSPAPTVVSPITYCQNATAAPLTATGTNLLWYTTIAGGLGVTTLTPTTATAGSTTYYVTQNSTCGESVRTPLTVVVNTTPAAPTATAAIGYCQGATASVLTATGTNLQWYANPTGGPAIPAPTPSTTTAGTINYYVSQTILGCESPRTMIAVTVTAAPALPTVISPLTYCIGGTASVLTATGTGLKWYATATGGPALSGAPTPLTTAIGTTTYYVSKTIGGCESGRAPIVVNVTAVTPAPTVTSPVVYCQGATATALVATGTNLLWYSTLTGGPAGTTSAATITTTTTGTTTYYVSQTGNCESPRAAIVVTVNSTPAAPIVTAAISYCQGSPAVALTATGTLLKWYADATTTTPLAGAPIPSTTSTGTTIYYVSQTTGACEGPRTSITVTVTSAPSITAQPQDITSCATTATFNVTATGTGLTYQWFVSTDAGATYLPIAGATTSTLNLTGLTPAQSNNKYRCVVSSGSCTIATSISVSAKVGTNPVVLLTAAPTTAFNPYTNGGLYATVSPAGNYSYKWTRNNTLLTTTASSITKTNGLLDDFGAYLVTVTDNITGCIGLSNSVSVSDVPDSNDQLFTSPNPTNGIVKISYYSSTAAAQTRTVDIYDNKGARIIVTNLTFTGRYGSATVDLTPYIKGNYFIILRDASGVKLASQKVIKY